MIGKFVLHWQLLGEEVLTVLHYDMGSLDPTDMQPYVDVLADSFVELADTYISDDLELTHVKVYDVSTPNPIGLGIIPSNAPIVGLATTGNLPPPVAILAHGFALGNEYPNRVTTYFPGVCEAENEDTGRPNINIRTAIFNLMEVWKVLEVPEQPSLPRLAVTYNSVGQVVASNPIAQNFVSTKYGIQRRRNYD